MSESQCTTTESETPQLSVIHCECNLDSLLPEYHRESAALGVHLEYFDRDIGAFHSSHLREELTGKLIPPTAPQPKPSQGERSIKNKKNKQKKSPKLPPGDGDAWGAVQKHSLGPGSPNSDSNSVLKILPKSTSGRRRATRRGKVSSETRPRGGAAIRAAGGDQQLASERKLLLKWMTITDSYQTNSYSLERDGSRGKPGWSGRNPPLVVRLEIRRQYKSKKILDIIAKFFPVYCDLARPAILLDTEQRPMFYRSSQWPLLLANAVEFNAAITKLLETALACRKMKSKFADATRGPHLACIIGVDRQHKQTPKFTKWHLDNAAAVEEFMNTPIIKSVTDWVCRIVSLVFPGVADQLRTSSQWHYSKYGIRPPFNLFWNLCINAMFKGQKRIHCLPHADWKNTVGVCVLVIYEVPGKKFNHSKRTWLVLWEAGVVIQLPPWVIAAYPSSLLYHFNVDISDFKFVTTDGEERPTPENSTPLEEGDDEGRGSLVYFNQATMYQSSETNSATIGDAVKGGHSGKTDYQKDIQESFEKHGVYTKIQLPTT